MRNVIRDGKGTECRRSARVNNALLDLGTVESLLLFEKDVVALDWDTADIERMTCIRDDLSKVASVVGRILE